MKRIPTWILCMIIILILTYVLAFQREDVMKMEHWLELIGLEFVIQLLYNRLTEKSNNNGNIS